ncbi:hypothetical protein GYMLUDRAFT_71406 [Collybiopsis luxurians FD-317 M1]|uniref:3-oxo-5-alpha-steroid 4-dehydrogenase C-terminal domain-containing protein n=1 Tax=Collybiopsis luxurians FD-317 M1 TaxID=944289 RepID=A0A0D0BIL0_9AGAR|nr:hypothetical protein GYMLUDRAFT_71406 [Collybiopsis luxurians FD-317 M1]
MHTLSATEANVLYDASRKWFTIVSAFICPATFVINAPFGRFAQTGKSLLNINLDGRKSWIIMEIFSPIMFIICFLTSPLSRAEPVSFGPSRAQYTLAAAYLVHYANRAIISPVRTPSRSKSHIIVPLAGITFNVLNGSLVGTYLSSPAAFAYLSSARPSFYLGLGIWATGLAGNIIHDEILMNIRRKAKSKADGKTAKTKNTSEHYAIPYGLLYKYISFPNYFCEWIEWAGFALAASPLPFVTSPNSSVFANIALTMRSLISPSAIADVIRAPSSLFAPRLTPPWIFLLNEIVLMLPRAYRGHQWYKQKFGESYPKERRVVVPFIW